MPTARTSASSWSLRPRLAGTESHQERCAVMNLGVRLALYTGITAGLVYGLESGARWLVTPDPELQRALQARPTPSPPRIAESIVRRIPLPVQEPPPPV